MVYGETTTKYQGAMQDIQREMPMWSETDVAQGALYQTIAGELTSEDARLALHFMFSGTGNDMPGKHVRKRMGRRRGLLWNIRHQLLGPFEVPEAVVAKLPDVQREIENTVRSLSQRERAILAKLPDREHPFNTIVRNAAKRTQTTNSLTDLLHEAGVPETAINNEIWQYAKQLQENPVVSRNTSFIVTDVHGNQQLYKVFTKEDKARATMEAAANYYLAPQLAMIAPGMHPTPLKTERCYVTVQEVVADGPIMPISYWIANLAVFHREAERILKENNVQVKEVIHWSPDRINEDYEQARREVEMNIDQRRMIDASSYLSKNGERLVIHNDPKKGNLRGEYLVDLEGIGMGHPAIDITLLFMQRNIPRQQWNQYTNMYLTARDGQVEEPTKRELDQALDHAFYYVAGKEIIGSSLRRITEETQRDNATLQEYLAA
jgi:hypothetical protein